MGFINSIKEWIERKNNKKLLEASVEQTKQAENSRNEEPLKIMLKIADENPKIVAEFIQEIIKRKDISDSNVEEFLKEAPSINRREAIRGIRTLDSKVNIKGEAAPGIAESLKQNAEDLDNPDLERIMEAMKKVGKSDMNSREEEAFKEQKENLEKQIEKEKAEERKKIEIKKAEERKKKEIIQKKNRESAKTKIEKLKENKDEKYWLSQNVFYRTNEEVIDKLFQNKPDKKEIKEFKKVIAELISEKKAKDFAKFGSTIIYSGEENLRFEDMIKYNVPNLTQNYYNQIPQEQKIYNVDDINKEITKLILRQIARKDAKKYNEKKDERELYITPIIPDIIKNNPDITPEQIKEYEDIYIQEMNIVLKDNKIEETIIINNLEEDKASTINKKTQLIDESVKILNELPNEYIEAFNKTLNEARDKIKKQKNGNEEENEQKENEQEEDGQR